MKQLIELSTKTIILKRNEYLKYNGSTDTNLYYLENGSMRIFIVSEGEEQIIRLAYNGNLITSLDSFLTDKPSELFIQAIKNSTVRVITKQQIDQFLKEDENQKLWIKILENLIVQQLEREIDILTKSPAERYQRVLGRSPHLFQYIPYRYIANYLKMSPETLSRLKKS